jgi:hypothetical protein
MNYLTISDLRLIFSDFVNNKWELLMRFVAGAIYGPAIKERLPELLEVEAKLNKRPLAEQLKVTDVRHDLFVRAIHYFYRAFHALPLLSEAHRQLVSQVGEIFAPTLSAIQAPYQDEADAAKQRRVKLDEMADALSAYPIGPGLTLFDLVSGYVEAGAEIDALLRERADATTAAMAPDAVNAGLLRGAALGLLGRLRETVDDEAALNPNLTAKMAKELFAYTDQLAATRDEQASRAAAAKKGQEAAPTAQAETA